MRLHFIRRTATIILFLSVVLAGFYAAVGKCPPCVKSLQLEPDERHGLNAGRRIVKVCITGSWDESAGQTDDRVWNAVRDAVNDWNNATSAGNKIPYFFELDQGSLNDDCTLPIVKGNADPFCTHVNVSSGSNPEVWRIVMPESTVNSMGATALQSAFAHEFGHALGLSGAQGACCPSDSARTSNFSIMTRSFGGCKFVYTNTVQARDVDQVRRQSENSVANCTLTANQVTGLSDALCPDMCEDPSCPGFDEELCANSSDTQTCADEPGECSSIWLVHNYYFCNGSGCTYLYSEWEFLGVECSTIMFDECA